MINDIIKVYILMFFNNSDKIIIINSHAPIFRCKIYQRKIYKLYCLSL